ncbi:MAG: ComEC/Rec2 family competence protein [Vulcanimicrobiaceae bacterium]
MMATSPSFYVLDVGHGSCAVLLCPDSPVFVFDVAHAATLIDFLQENNIKVIDALFVSHADQDHIGGVVGILSCNDVRVGSIYVNANAAKATKGWATFKVAVAGALKNGAIDLDQNFNSDKPGTIDAGVCSIQILSPDSEWALGGPGMQSEAGVLTANDLCAVMRVVVGEARILVAADLTMVAWQRILAQGKDVKADILVMPHHGGGVGANDGMADIVKAVQPRFGVVSNGRSRYDNPRPEATQALIDLNAYVACTQLSERCGKAGTSGTLGPGASRGSASGSCCGGTMAFLLKPDGVELLNAHRHVEFVGTLGNAALCAPNRLS